MPNGRFSDEEDRDFSIRHTLHPCVFAARRWRCLGIELRIQEAGESACLCAKASRTRCAALSGACAGPHNDVLHNDASGRDFDLYCRELRPAPTRRWMDPKATPEWRVRVVESRKGCDQVLIVAGEGECFYRHSPASMSENQGLDISNLLCYHPN